MRGLLIVGVSLIALADRAAADDIMVTKAAPIPYSVPAAYDWSGFFAGGHLGYAWGSSNWTGTTPAARALSSSGSIDLFQSFDAFEDTGSYFEGLQAGYNYMLPNRVLIGAEADVSIPSFPSSSTGLGIGGASTLTLPPIGAQSYSENILAFGTVRGRIGYAPGNWLFYATGGFAWTYDQLSLTQTATGTSEVTVHVAAWLGSRSRRRSAGRATLDSAPRISVHRLRHHKRQICRRGGADRFQSRDARAARRLELSVRQRHDTGANGFEDTRDA